MSFRYKSTTVTLENYSKIFKDCTPDILDEIRSAVLDATAIAKFIDHCGDDSYKLGQFRMASRELIPVEYLNTRLTGKTIYIIRQGFNKARDMSSLLRYINSKSTLEVETIEILAEYVFLGTDISKVDFNIVPRYLVKTVCKGLYQGYPMWLLIEEGSQLTESTIHILMRGLQLGVDVHPFLNGLWSDESISLILLYAKSVDLGKVIPLLNHNFDVDTLQVLLDLASKGIPITRLCAKDTSGMPVYNRYQIYEIGRAIEDDAVVEEMYQVTMSDMSIASLHDSIIVDRNRKLSTSLGRKS